MLVSLQVQGSTAADLLHGCIHACHRSRAGTHLGRRHDVWPEGRPGPPDQQRVVAGLPQAQQLPQHADVVLPHAARLLLQALQPGGGMQGEQEVLGGQQQ